MGDQLNGRVFVFAAGGPVTPRYLLRLPSRWSLRWKLF